MIMCSCGCGSSALDASNNILPNFDAIKSANYRIPLTLFQIFDKLKMRN